MATVLFIDKSIVIQVMAAIQTRLSPDSLRQQVNVVRIHNTVQVKITLHQFLQRNRCRFKEFELSKSGSGRVPQPNSRHSHSYRRFRHDHWLRRHFLLRIPGPSGNGIVERVESKHDVVQCEIGLNGVEEYTGCSNGKQVVVLNSHPHVGAAK